MRDLRALIERVERLEGPSREVDYEIGRIAIPDDWCDSTDDLGNPIQINRASYYQQRIGDSRPTASLDAAIALCERVLPGWHWCTQKRPDTAIAYVNNNEPHHIGITSVPNPRKRWHEVRHADPVIALVLATLRALEAQEGRTMSAREIIAKTLQDILDPQTGDWVSDTYRSFSDDLIHALTAAGYRILAPGELDPETVERCAQAAEHLNGWGQDCGRGGHAEHIASAIRALSEGGGE